MSREVIVGDGAVYVKKRPGESWHGWACWFCKRQVFRSNVWKKRAQGSCFIGVYCACCGYVIPRRVCRAFIKARQPKRRGWRK